MSRIRGPTLFLALVGVIIAIIVPTVFLPTVLFPPEEPKLEERGVSTRQGTHAVHTLTYYARRFGLHAHDYPGAHMAEGLSLTLPLYPTMTEAEQDYVVEQLRACGP